MRFGVRNIWQSPVTHIQELGDVGGGPWKWVSEAGTKDRARLITSVVSDDPRGNVAAGLTPCLSGAKDLGISVGYRLRNW